MPGKRSLKLDQLEFLAIKLGNDFGPPMFGDFRELLGKFDSFQLHGPNTYFRCEIVRTVFAHSALNANTAGRLMSTIEIAG